MHSQNDEEHAIVSYFGDRTGRFLDIGAHDGVTFSNTRRLFEQGWTGTLVEPSPCVFPALMNLYHGCDDVNLANLALVADSARILKFYDSRGDFVSTFDEQHRALWANQVGFQPIYVAATTVKELLKVLPGPYKFVSVDVEGINCELFADLPLREIGAEMVCVEYQYRLDECDSIAARQDFQRFHVTSENALYVRA